MDMVESLDYEKVQAAILAKYDFNSETYRFQFRSTEVKEDKTQRKLYARLKERDSKWLQPQHHTKEKI